MSKAVMWALQPKQCENIANGKQTILVFKTIPKDLKPPFKVYIYCTYGGLSKISFQKKDPLLKVDGMWQTVNGKVIGEFVCNSIDEIKCDNGIQAYFNNKKETCLSDFELMLNATKGKPLYLLHISNLKIYDNPKKLEEFKRLCKHYYSENPPCDDCYYFVDYRTYEYDESDCGVDGFIPIIHPPKTWCYVEEMLYEN